MTFADLTVALGNHSRQKHFQGISVTCLVSLPEVSWRQVIIILIFNSDLNKAFLGILFADVRFTAMCVRIHVHRLLKTFTRCSYDSYFEIFKMVMTFADLSTT